ncbi:endo-1,3;1,4-beta-D-glucanase-like [Primulina eburnea]|uniref:endo-1,3;1,4-beta-D-glucanase-like n=1 Tax=Primulina eburnea TaxID=1245227 RepID=UPI003C6C76D5
MGTTERIVYTFILIYLMLMIIARTEKSAAERRLLPEELHQIQSDHAKLGPKCSENPPLLNGGSGGGSVLEMGGLQCYVSGPSDSKLAIVLASDIYGYTAPNLRKLADKVAASGFYAVVPDFFHGDPFDPTNPNKTKPVWMAQHDPIKAFEDTKPVLEALRGRGTSAIGVAGFCYGGKVAVELVKCGIVQAGVLLHPSLVTEDDMKEVNLPLAILGAENDHVSCPPKLVKRFKEILSSKKIPNFAKIFPGVAHGWTLRYNLTDKKAVKAADKAHLDMLNWLIKYVD